MRNEGEGGAGTFFTGVYLSTDSIITPEDRLLVNGREPIESLPPFGQVDVVYLPSTAIPEDVLPGAYWIGAYADDGFDVGEGEDNELNNSWSAPISIEPYPPDLVISAFVSPAAARPGDVIGPQLDVWVRNDVAGEAAGFGSGTSLMPGSNAARSRAATRRRVAVPGYLSVSSRTSPSIPA